MVSAANPFLERLVINAFKDNDMKDYYSTMTTTCNENGDEEVELVYNRGFFRWLFRMERRKENYVGSGTVWYSKGEGRRAGTLKECEIRDVIEMHRQERAYAL